MPAGADPGRRPLWDRLLDVVRTEDAAFRGLLVVVALAVVVIALSLAL